MTFRALSLFVRADVAVLYVDPRGPYPSLVRTWFDAEDDARRYAGPWPVVAHPPCGPWGRLRHLSRHDDPTLALRAVEQVRCWGGVLEHPAYSKLWDAARLPRPGEPADAWGGVSLRVDQVDFGHVARKATWLYVVGAPVPALPSRREPTHWISGSRQRLRDCKGCGLRQRAGTCAAFVPHRGIRGYVPDGIKVCSAEQRRRTPEPFARWLVELAASARPQVAE